ncbi:MAG: helix-turn-helix domain-containing protein [Desulfitobacteriaceae bacterium]
MELWEVFQKLATENDAKIADIARDTGIPYTTIDSIIKKQLKDIKFDNAVKIAKYFSVPVEYLASGVLVTKKDKPVLEGIEQLNEYGVKRLKLYLEEVLLRDKDCIKRKG